MERKILVIGIISAMLLCSTIAFSRQESFVSVPPEQAGIHSSSLFEILHQVFVGRLDIHSLLVLKNKRVVLEAYMDPYHPGDRHNVKSVSKSFLSAQVGIALEKKLIKSIDAKLIDAFPTYFADQQDSRKQSITLEHLLTMQSGFDYLENSAMSRRWTRGSNWVEAAINMPMFAVPGSRFRYSTANSHLVSAWLTDAAKMSTRTFAEKYLFTPLGIDNCDWLQDPQGIHMGGTQLYLTPKDMAKFGVLYLNNGQYGGKQIISKQWVQRSIDWQVTTSDNTGYGFWWWRTPDNEGFMAAGWGGQRIVIWPKKELVVVITAAHAKETGMILQQLSEIAVSQDPLPPNPEDYAELQKLVEQLASPLKKALGPIPAVARNITNKSYSLTKNPFDIENLSIEFKHINKATLHITSDNDTIFLQVGMDGLYRITPTGTWGGKRDNNRIALRGRWEDERLILNWHVLGESTRLEASLVFHESGFTGVVTSIPGGSKTPLLGKLQ